MKVIRVIKNDNYVIGNFYINEVFLSNTLENPIRIVNNDCTQKIFGHTAIPEGTYTVEMEWWDKHQDYYPHIENVPCFDGILIHGGITTGDTEGCILVGENDETTNPGELTNCKYYQIQINNAINAATSNGESVTITIE